MKIHFSKGLTAVIVAMGLGSAASFAAPALLGDQPGLKTIQYDRYPNDRYPNNGYQDQRGNGTYDRDFRGGSRWRPGQVVPGQVLNLVVPDWEERGLGRPPGGHQWLRVGQQFLLVRVRDGMIARVISFD